MACGWGAEPHTRPGLLGGSSGEPQQLSPARLQTANGNVEAKVVCFYRRRDISSTLIALADKHASECGCRGYVCVWG